MECPECGGVTVQKGKLTANQQKALDTWNAVVGFDFMHLDDVLEGEMSFQDAFNANVRWLEGVLGTASNAYRGECPCICHEEKVT